MSKTLYQITKSKKHTIKNKINKNRKTTWNTIVLGAKIIHKTLGQKKEK